MTPLEVDYVAIARRLEAAKTALGRLEGWAQASPGGVETMLVRGAVAAAMTEIDEVVRLLRLTEPLPNGGRVPCPFCEHMIVPTATTCGFCWREIILAVVDA